jgi:hypothetical protein
MGNVQLENYHHHDWNRNKLIYFHSGGHLLSLMNKKRNIFMYRRCCYILTIYKSTPIFKKNNNKNKKHNVGFKPFNFFNCQMHTNAGKANSLINHVKFWIEMYKNKIVYLAFKMFSTNQLWKYYIYSMAVVFLVIWLQICVCVCGKHTLENTAGPITKWTIHRN